MINIGLLCLTSNNIGCITSRSTFKRLIDNERERHGVSGKVESADERRRRIDVRHRNTLCTQNNVCNDHSHDVRGPWNSQSVSQRHLWGGRQRRQWLFVTRCRRIADRSVACSQRQRRRRVQRWTAPERILSPVEMPCCNWLISTSPSAPSLARLHAHTLRQTASNWTVR